MLFRRLGSKPVPNMEMWNVSQVTDMDNMFSQATSFNQNLSTWDVSNVTTMAHMFDFATNFNGNISNWNVSKVNAHEFHVFIRLFI